MTAEKAGKGRRASARRSAVPAPQEDRLDRLERMLEVLVSQGSVGVKIYTPEEMARPADDDEPEEKFDRAAELAKRRARERVEDEAAQTVLLHLIDPRHKEIFDWLCHVQGGKRAAQLLKEMLRASLVRERPAYRESQGRGGNSSRNAAALAERLPGRK